MKPRWLGARPGICGQHCNDGDSGTIAQAVGFGPILITGLSGGVHTFAVQWRMNAGTGYLHADADDADYRNEEPVIFWAREVS